MDAGVVPKYGIPSDPEPPGSAVKPAPFAYHRAEGVEQAISLLAGLGDEAKILAGGRAWSR